MKKILIGLGIGITLLLATTLQVKSSYKKSNTSAKDYLNTTAPKLLANWSEQEFLNNSHPKVKETVPADKLRAVFQKYRQLGKLKSYEGTQDGKVQWGYSKELGKYKISTNQALATFENGQAVITFQIAQTQGEWRILSIYVNSPKFLE
jgi:hypothetical protein